MPVTCEDSTQSGNLPPAHPGLLGTGQSSGHRGLITFLKVPACQLGLWELGCRERSLDSRSNVARWAWTAGLALNAAFLWGVWNPGACRLGLPLPPASRTHAGPESRMSFPGKRCFPCVFKFIAGGAVARAPRPGSISCPPPTA